MDRELDSHDKTMCNELEERWALSVVINPSGTFHLPHSADCSVNTVNTALSVAVPSTVSNTVLRYSTEHLIMQTARLLVGDWLIQIHHRNHTWSVGQFDCVSSAE
jgi:hypothetical protein